MRLGSTLQKIISRKTTNPPLHLGYHVNPTLTCRLSATLSVLTSIRSFTLQAFPALWVHMFILSQICMNYWPIISVLLFINPVHKVLNTLQTFSRNINIQGLF